MSKISLGKRRRLRSKRKVGNGGRSGRIPQRGSQRRKPLWTEKEGTLGVGRRQCKSQRDQLNPTKALDSESPKLCLLIQLLSLVESAAPPSSPSCTPHASQDLRTARPAPSEWSRTRPPPCEQTALPQPGWGPTPRVHSGGTSGLEPPTVPECPAAARIPPLPQTPNGVEGKARENIRLD